MNLSSKNQHVGSPTRAHLNASRRQAFDSLLTSLSTDDAARAQFVADPAKVLESYGLEFDRDQIPSNLRLPSKETIAAARTKIAAEEEENNFIFFIIFPSRNG